MENVNHHQAVIHRGLASPSSQAMIVRPRVLPSAPPSAMFVLDTYGLSALIMLVKLAISILSCLQSKKCAGS